MHLFFISLFVSFMFSILQLKVFFMMRISIIWNHDANFQIFITVFLHLVSVKFCTYHITYLSYYLLAAIKLLLSQFKSFLKIFYHKSSEEFFSHTIKTVFWLWKFSDKKSSLLPSPILWIANHPGVESLGHTLTGFCLMNSSR